MHLLGLVEAALRQHGYHVTPDAALEGQSGTVYTVPLLVECGGKAYLLDEGTDGVLPAREQQALEDICDDVGADGAVLCHLAGAETAATTRLRLWGRDDLLRILGEAALASIGAAAVPPDLAAESPRGSPIAESMADLLPPAFREAEPDDEQPMFTVDLDALEQLGESGLLAGFDEASPDDRDEPLAAEMPAAPLDAAHRFAYPVLPVRVTAMQAMARAQERLFRAAAVEMVLQPVHLLDYECDLLAEGSLRYDTVRGRIQVHGTDKSTVEVDAEAVDPGGFTKMVPDDVPHSERTLRTSEERAKERARTFLVAAHTRVVNVQVDDTSGSFAYTEKKKVAPRPDHVRLHHLGVFHRVLWRVRGPNGHIDIDGLTGDEVQETLATPDPGAFMLD